jgi:hypothetical protein
MKNEKEKKGSIFQLFSSTSQIKKRYAAYVSSYGSVTASLAPSPGTDVEVFVTFLTDKQLEHMHVTEGG